MKYLICIIIILLTVGMGSAGTKTICSSGCDYASVSAWENGENGDITGLGPSIGMITGSFEDTTAVTFDSWTTTPTDYIMVTSNGTGRHDGVWNESKYYMNVTNSATSILYLRENYIRIDGIQIQLVMTSGTGRAIGVYTADSGDSDIRVSNCIVRLHESSTSQSYGIHTVVNADNNITAYNNIVYGFLNAGSRAFSIGHTSDFNILNCVVYNNTCGIGRSGGNVTVNNTASFDNSDDFLGTIVIGNCASDDGDGDNNQTPSDWGNEFVDFINGSFALKSGSILRDNGTTISSFSDDIIGTSRPQNSVWDIGAFEYIVAAAAGTPDPVSLSNTTGETWVNHTWSAGTAPNVTDSYNVSVNSTWHNTTTVAYHNNTPIPNGNWSNITVWAWNSTYNELSSGSVSEDVQTTAAAGVPDIISSGYTDNLWPEVYDDKTFNVTVNQTTECRWYVNGTLKQTNSTPSLTHAYTNTSLEGGHWNFSAVVNNTNGSDIQTWNFEVGADSVTHIVLADDPTNKSMIAKNNITRIGSNVTDWGINLTYTFSGWVYYFRFDNGTEIMNATCSSDNESMYFNGTSLLPIGVYFINATSGLTAPANQYYMFNNWDIDQNFSQIAANESNDICYSWYNHTSGLHEAYYVGRSYNADKIVSMNCSVFGFFDAQTNIDVTPRTT